MISIKHLSKTFRNPDGSQLTVLKDVNCDIEKGEVISIIGPLFFLTHTLIKERRYTGMAYRIEYTNKSYPHTLVLDLHNINFFFFF